MPIADSASVATTDFRQATTTDARAFPLFERIPGLASACPRVAIGRWPTPVECVRPEGGVEFWVKRDDGCHRIYAGNKIRKLEFIFGAARAQRRKRLFVVGYAGSNFTLAASLHGRQLGFYTTALLLPQKVEPYVRRNLLWSSQAGADLQLASSEPALAWVAMRKAVASRLREGCWPMWVPAGGSSPAGVLGFVNAGLELAEQVGAGQMPSPRRIYIAVGSMGSAVGLSLGCGLAGLDTDIVAVPVTAEKFASPERAGRLAAECWKLLAGQGRGLGAQPPLRIDWRPQYKGAAYGVPTPQSAAAAEWLAAQGLRADQTYAAKALACMRADLGNGEVGAGEALFWLTSNGTKPSALPAPFVLPEKIRRYLEGATAR